MHVWIIERKEMYTKDNFTIFDFALTRRVARAIISDMKRYGNLNSKGPHYTYRIRKYVRED